MTVYSLGGLLDGDTIVKGVTYLASGKEVGTYDGVFIIDLDELEIVNENGDDVTHCYTIEENPGQLIIDPKTPDSSSSTPPDSSSSTPPDSSSSTPSSSSSGSSDSSSSSSTPSSSSTSDSSSTPIVPESNTEEPPIIPPAVEPPVTPPGITPITPVVPAVEPAASVVEPAQLESGSGIETTTISGDAVPLGGLSMGNGWSLLNLMMGLFAVLGSIILFGSLFKRNKDYIDDQIEDGFQFYRERSTLLKIVTIVSGIVPGVLFLILENIRLPMVWITKWTPLIGAFFIIFLILVLVYVVIKVRHKEKVEEEIE